MKVLERRRPIVEMNMIPLIDVSLILVIIFMVLTPILVQSQLTVKLPDARSGEPVAAETSITIEISRAGTVMIEGSPVKWGELEKEMALRLPKASRKTVLVQADQSVPVDRVVKVLDAAKRLGVGKLGIGVAK